ncbi:thermonuclease family protein [Mycoplasmopsis opalescens]|uniref:thermonuclease family protein n=1 Tax=Mycoplasmopsis opalescens TaxID=114886 RepID=UPI000A066C10|nr:thermonuclease family protein [Mycoplasmopsis opalescens]
MKIKLIFLAPLLLPLVSSQCVHAAIDKNSYISIEKYKVVDGDTLLIYEGSKESRIRLLGVDAPELQKDFNKENLAKYENYFAKSAKKFVEKTLQNKPIKLMKIRPDKYGRMVANVIATGEKNLSAELLKSGLVKMSFFDIKNKRSPYYMEFQNSEELWDLFQKAEADAKTLRKGIWQYKLNEVFHK